jgi:hypothetical protein
VHNGLLLPCCCSGEKNNLASDMEVNSFITTVQGGSGCWFQWIISILLLKRNKKRGHCWSWGRPAGHLLSLLKKYKISVQDQQAGCSAAHSPRNTTTNVIVCTPAVWLSHMHHKTKQPMTRTTAQKNMPETKIKRGHTKVYHAKLVRQYQTMTNWPTGPSSTCKVFSELEETCRESGKDPHVPAHPSFQMHSISKQSEMPTSCHPPEE